MFGQSCIEPPLPAMSKQTLHAFYFMVSNCGQVIPFEKFASVVPSCDTKTNIAEMIFRLRKLLKPYGLYIVSKRKIGYKCINLRK